MGIRARLTQFLWILSILFLCSCQSTFYFRYIFFCFVFELFSELSRRRDMEHLPSAQFDASISSAYGRRHTPHIGVHWHHWTVPSRSQYASEYEVQWTMPHNRTIGKWSIFFYVAGPVRFAFGTTYLNMKITDSVGYLLLWGKYIPIVCIVIYFCIRIRNGTHPY